MTTSLIDGIGAILGDRLALESPLIISGNVWYVLYSTGVDAASPAGRERLKPLKTLAQAVTNAAAGDIIVLLAGHAETLTAAQSLAKALTIIGEGTAGAASTATFTRNAAAASLFTCSIAGVEIRNVTFAASSQSTATARIVVSAGPCRFSGCYFQGNANDIGSWVSLTAGSVRFDGCTFVSTSITTPPEEAIGSATAISDVEITDCVFDGGTVGFANGYAIENITNAITRLRMEGVSLLRGADIALLSTTTGYVNVTATGGGKVAW